jgi:PadR family transcriptional regulator PadR
LAAAILDRPTERHYGYQLGKTARVRSGVLYPILGRWLEAGWLTDHWEDPSESGTRPPKRFYLLTDQGRDQLATLADYPAEG